MKMIPRLTNVVFPGLKEGRQCCSQILKDKDHLGKKCPGDENVGSIFLNKPKNDPCVIED